MKWKIVYACVCRSNIQRRIRYYPAKWHTDTLHARQSPLRGYPKQQANQGKYSQWLGSHSLTSKQCSSTLAQCLFMWYPRVYHIMYGISLRLDSINKHSTSVTRLVDDMFIFCRWFPKHHKRVLSSCLERSRWTRIWSNTVCDILVNDQYESGYIILVNSWKVKNEFFAPKLCDLMLRA